MIFGEKVIHTRLQVVGRNPHGQPIYDDVELPPIYGASLQRVDSVEPSSGMSFRVITEAILYVPPTTDVQDMDKITVRGETYEVQGESIGEVSAFTGFQAHIPVKLKKVTG